MRAKESLHRPQQRKDNPSTTQMMRSAEMRELAVFAAENPQPPLGRQKPNSKANERALLPPS
jgi:hypothetical protein